MDFLILMLASGEDRPTNIRAQFNHAETADKYGFPQEDFATSYVCKKVNDCRRKPELAQRVGHLRSQFLLDFSDVPLAHKKHRVLELIELYQSVDDMLVHDSEGELVDAPIVTKINQKQSILKQIAGEMDDSADKLAAAITQGASNMVAGIELTAQVMLEMAYVLKEEAETEIASAGVSATDARFGDSAQIPN